MVKIALQLKATLENIERLGPSSVSDFRWYFKFSCSNCGEISDKWNYVSLSEATPAARGNGVNHFVTKCKLCSRENTVSIFEDSIKSLVVQDSSNEFQTVAMFDCRGLEPCDFSAREGWSAKAVDGGKEFIDIDLSDGEWADYCDKINNPVGVYEIEHRFQRIK